MKFKKYELLSIYSIKRSLSLITGFLTPCVTTQQELDKKKRSEILNKTELNYYGVRRLYKTF